MDVSQRALALYAIRDKSNGPIFIASSNVAVVVGGEYGVAADGDDVPADDEPFAAPRKKRSIDTKNTPQSLPRACLIRCRPRSDAGVSS